jgi:hypothetical protein
VQEIALNAVTPYPPSPDETDQHAVVTLTVTCTLVTLLGVICYVGIEPTDAAPASPYAFTRRSPSGQVVLASVSSDYQLHRLLD